MPLTWSLSGAARDQCDAPLCDKIATELKLDPLLAQLLYMRGIQSVEDARLFLYPKLTDLRDPNELHGIPEAVTLIEQHHALGNRIMIHGDYDVDGCTSAAIMARCLSLIAKPPLVFIPHRTEHGYGFGAAGIAYAQENDVKLMITTDCGVTAYREIEEVRQLRIDVLVIDHHLLGDEGLPQANVIIHPEVDGNTSAFSGLSAAGLCFKLAQALAGRAALEWLDLAALGTVADVAPLTGENRIMVKFGLEQLSRGVNPGLKALAHEAKLKSTVVARDLAFVFGPRVNASGRIGSAGKSLRLLTTNDKAEARDLAHSLEGDNRTRQKLERKAVREAVRTVEREVNFSRDKVIVVWSHDWHPGVVGIVAARLVDKYHRPSIVISLFDGWGRGSARSVRGVDVHALLEQSQATLITFGGHAQAAGVEVEEKNLQAFRRQINLAMNQSIEPEMLLKTVRVDIELDTLGALSMRFIQQTKLLEPLGQGNRKPVFMTKGLSLKGNPTTPHRHELRFWVQNEDTVLEARWKYPQYLPWDQCEQLDLVYSPAVTQIEGNDVPYLEVRDVRLSQERVS